MAQITDCPSTAGLGSAYNAFLFAPIADESVRAPLNTVSVLARLDIDPWREAAELTSMPTDTAIQRLAALLVQMPDLSEGLQDAEIVAVRLIALLPGHDHTEGPFPAQTATGRKVDPKFVALGFGLAVLVLLSGAFQANQDQAVARVGNPIEASSPSALAPLLSPSHP